MSPAMIDSTHGADRELKHAGGMLLTASWCWDGLSILMHRSGSDYNYPYRWAPGKFRKGSHVQLTEPKDLGSWVLCLDSL